VLIKGTANSGEVVGTGFIISSDGKIATNLHVVESLKNGGVQLASGEKFDSFSVLAFDARKDFAIIKIPGFDLPTVALRNSNNVQVGEPVLAVGSPLGLQGTVTTGVVSSMRDDPFTRGFLERELGPPEPPRRRHLGLFLAKTLSGPEINSVFPDPARLL